MNSETSLYTDAEFYDSLSKYTISTNPAKIKIRFLSNMTTRISENYLPIEKIGIGIQKISDVIITKITYKKIKDITQDTLERDFFGSNTIDDLIESRANEKRTTE